MENFSAYELAQQRIEQRRRKQNHTLLWLLLAIASTLLIFVTGVSGYCAVPLGVFSVVFAVLSGIDWYFISTRGMPPVPKINEEMTWLFGESWESDTGVHEFSLALERIHNRSKARVKFMLHLILFLVANGIIVGLMIYNLRHFPDLPVSPIVIMPIVWLIVLIIHAVRTFPTRRRLEQREREAGETIRREIEQMQPAKRKNKLKRDVFYVLNDDGELVEVDQEAIESEKPKYHPPMEKDGEFKGMTREPSLCEL